MSYGPRVLLVWPGSEGTAGGNFGVPQLVLLASELRSRVRCRVEIRDLVAERALPGWSLDRMLEGDDGAGYDVIGFSVYSSYDYLKCLTLATLARRRWPEAVLVAGGYHASARPNDIVFDGSPFDICVVGEGEIPLVRIVESVAGGVRPKALVLGPEPVADLDALAPADWSLLARYRQVARQVASQALVYLSRGCPYPCAFCMERAKRETSWRALSVERALMEIENLHRFLDLGCWTLFVSDAVFGLDPGWRLRFLERLAEHPLPVRALWLLTRIDLVDLEQMPLWKAARAGLGFGLESGSAEILRIARKTTAPERYLAQAEAVTARASELGVPWGVNVIVGHPGETRATLLESGATLERLFERPGSGFLSVDPFRLYPGSSIDAHRADYEQRYGTRFYRPAWWQDGDQAFLSEWVDPSTELDYSTREALTHSAFAPLLGDLERRFTYQGPDRAYYLASIREQAALTLPRARLGQLERRYAWLGYLGYRARAEQERRRDPALGEVARALREEAVAAVTNELALAPTDPLVVALAEVPRERFVPLDRIAESVGDQVIPLDASGQATVSALHAYARAYRLLEIVPGDRVLDLGCGSGYGAALLARLVGSTGKVYGVEVDPKLCLRAEAELANTSQVTLVTGNALEVSLWGVDPGAVDKVHVGFALSELPEHWIAALRPGAVIVAPIGGGPGGQRFARVTVARQGARFEWFDPVWYVAARTSVNQ